MWICDRVTSLSSRVPIRQTLPRTRDTRKLLGSLVSGRAPPEHGTDGHACAVKPVTLKCPNLLAAVSCDHQFDVSWSSGHGGWIQKMIKKYKVRTEARRVAARPRQSGKENGVRMGTVGTARR